MSVHLKLPEELRPFAQGMRIIEVSGATIGDALDGLFAMMPQIRCRIVDKNAELYQHVIVLRNQLLVPRENLRDVEIDPSDDLELFFVASGG